MQILDRTSRQQEMATETAMPRKKMRILLMPFFATSHIAPFTDLAFHLVAARPDDVEATVAVTPANALVVQSALARRGASHLATVKVATYPFPSVDGLPPGVENHSTVKAAADAWRIDAVATDEKLMRPGQESLIREHTPDLIITDIHFSGGTSMSPPTSARHASRSTPSGPSRRWPCLTCHMPPVPSTPPVAW
ncbi:hypothetical protein Zm00014a_013694 [Zea mays]|uniref:Ig-like domain-containing protein n=1 Tax=Zea mays TaxID=4577 RepID=A0A3L6E653_MAIZE|nr:hypothetical protein Zm00014a_013694 [Zea mays]